MRWTCNLAK